MVLRPEASTERLAARIEALERRNRRLTWLLSTALVLGDLRSRWEALGSRLVL
jgi:hypothetical protein